MTPNAGQQWPTKANNDQQGPTKANDGPKQPAQASDKRYDDRDGPKRLVLGSPVQSGLSSIFGKTETETGLERLMDCQKPD
jgi:hypothetical protein